MAEHPTYEELEKKIQDFQKLEQIYQKTEAALRESQSKLMAHLQNTPMGAVSWDLNFNAIEWNPAAEAIFGYSKQEALGKHATQLILPEDVKEEVDDIFQDLIAGKGGTRSTNENTTKEGRRIICDWYNTVLKDDRGQVIAVASLVNDITDQILAEERLRKNEKELKSIFRAAPTGIGVVADRVFLEINERISEMTGYSIHELLGENARILYPNDEAFKHVGKEKYLQIQEKGTGSVEAKWQRKDGTLLDVLLSSTPIQLDDLSQGVTFTALDITELKRKETELMESEKKYRELLSSLRLSHKRFLTVLDSIDANIYVADMDSFEILFANKSMKKCFGRDMTGEICWKVFRGESNPCHHCTNPQLIDENGKPLGHCTWQDKNPVTGKWYINNDRAIEWTDGRVVRLQISTDITHLKQMEEEIRQAHKMESIGTLAGGIAHDFNNILYIILGNADLALEQVQEGNPVGKNLKAIKSAGFRAAGIVKQLLNFSRKTDQELKPLEAVAVIQDALNFLRSTIPTTIEIRKYLPDAQITILADPVQINQILMNVCTNAAQAMEETGGILEIHVERIYLAGEKSDPYPDLPEGDFLKIVVKDTGPGIDNGIIDRIFDPYFTTKELGKGSGLGLSVVHGIVKNHNGALWVDSQPGKGAVFTLLFPMVDQMPEIEVTPPDEISHGRERILFIDDEASIVEMMQDMLAHLGYTVETCLSPLEALERFSAQPHGFDLVITDMTMPQMTGAKLAEKLSKIRPGLPIIICTGHSSLMDEEKSRQSGIAGYVMKPVSMSDIAGAIRRVLENPL